MISFLQQRKPLNSPWRWFSFLHVGGWGCDLQFIFKAPAVTHFPQKTVATPCLEPHILPSANQQKCGGEKYNSDTPFVLRVGEKHDTQKKKHAWLLYQYKVNTMKLALMVHQFGTLGEEQGRLLWWMCCLGVTVHSNKSQHFPPHTWSHLIGPWLVDAVTAAITWCQQSITGNQTCHPLPHIGNLHSVSACWVSRMRLVLSSKTT